MSDQIETLRRSCIRHAAGLDQFQAAIFTGYPFEVLQMIHLEGMEAAEQKHGRSVVASMARSAATALVSQHTLSEGESLAMLEHDHGV
ncbi:MAG: hypothetical protein WD294_14925 [Phycisphaeraceae bacterium]